MKRLLQLKTFGIERQGESERTQDSPKTPTLQNQPNSNSQGGKSRSGQ